MNGPTNLVAPVALRTLVEKAYGDQVSETVKSLVGPRDGVVRDITHDSRRVAPDSLFCCLVGDQVDGHDLAREAINAGASALLVQHELPLDVAQIVVSDTRREMGKISAAFYDNPSKKMRVVGITGTNGKTTTAHLLTSILRQQGLQTEVFGTLTGERTTPESCDLQRNLWQAVNAGTQAVVMEVTSHAMSLQRVVGTNFEAAAFLNLSPEHLDFHKTIEKYFAAKASLFDAQFTKLGVINRDDVHGRLLLDATEIDTVSFGLDDASAREVSATHHAYVWKNANVNVRIGGKFNVMNSLAAATVALGLGVDIADIVSGLAGAGTVDGRYESVGGNIPFDVIVDYAHTPDALSRVLDTTRATIAPNGRIILVFGCGGDRDNAKRPMMGAIAASQADCVIVTSDNPRSEDPREIAAQITAGIADADRKSLLSVELDRRSAIELALMTAHTGDVVIIAGKGHETTQTIGDRVLPFNDAHVANELIGALL